MQKIGELLANVNKRLVLFVLLPSPDGSGQPFEIRKLLFRDGKGDQRKPEATQKKRNG